MLNEKCFINDIYNFGKIISINNDICNISGLINVMLGELLQFQNKNWGVVININKNYVTAVILYRKYNLSVNDIIKSTGKFLDVPVSYELLGRVINPLGCIIDLKKKINNVNNIKINKNFNIENYRNNKEFIYTGIKIIDSLIPITKGQKVSIIGNNYTGKTSIAIDTIINQRKNNIICIYVLIGKDVNELVNIFNILKNNKAMKYTILIFSNIIDSNYIKYISPYTGYKISEYFLKKKKDVIIIYDDLSMHSIAYKNFSLSINKPINKDGYPLDIFYLYNNLLNKNYYNIEKSGTLTSLSIIETKKEDVYNFFSKNIISLMDNKIFLNYKLLNKNIKPCIDLDLSISSLNNVKIDNIVNKLSINIKKIFIKYNILNKYNNLNKKELYKREKIIEFLKQDFHKTLILPFIIINLFCINYNHLNSVPLNKISLFEKILHKLLKKDKKLFNLIKNNNKLDNNIIKNLDKIIFIAKDKLNKLNK